MTTSDGSGRTIVNGAWLIVAALVMLLVFPVHAAGEQPFLDCGQLITTPAGHDAPLERDTGSILGVLTEQRLEIGCEDAIGIRWVYVVLSAMALIMTLVRPRTSQATRLTNVGLGTATLIVAAAAVFDGPTLPLGLVAIGSALGMWRLYLRARAIDVEAASWNGDES